MSFGLGHGRGLDVAPGVVGVTREELPPLPDAILSDTEAGRLDPRGWFANPGHPFEIEIGSGKGTFILEQASRAPGVNYLGIEQAGEFYAYASDRVRRRGLLNVRMLHADAVEFLRWRVPSGIVGVIHLYFSDPWPKKKHHKNRVVQDRFLAECWRVLGTGGELRIVTDHDELWAWNTEHFERWCAGGSGGGGALPEELRERFGLPTCPFVPFVMGAFVRPEWTEEGETIGTNYERKMCRGGGDGAGGGEGGGDGVAPHACVLKRVSV